MRSSGGSFEKLSRRILANIRSMLALDNCLLSMMIDEIENDK